EERILGVGDRLAFGNLPNKDLSFVVPSYNARRDARALLVDDHLGLTPFHDRDDAIGRPEVNTDNFTHVTLPPTLRRKLITQCGTSTACRDLFTSPEPE